MTSPASKYSVPMTATSSDTTSQPATSAHTTITSLWNGPNPFDRLGVASMGGLYRRPSTGSRSAVLGLLVATTALCVPRADASFADGQFSLDIARGPVIASGRVVGLGGAYTGVAEGVQGFFRSPAALANRTRHSVDWYDWDVAFDWVITPGSGVDFDNDGQFAAEDREFRGTNTGLSFQFGSVSLGVLIQTSGFEQFDPARTARIAVVDGRLGLAWTYGRGAWIVGVGIGDTEFDLVVDRHKIDKLSPEPEDTSAHYRAQGFDLGVLWRPPDQPWRLGLAYRRGLHMPLPEGSSAAGVLLPHQIIVPSQLSLGASYCMQASGAPYNRPLGGAAGWDADQPAPDRRYLLFAADLVHTGAARDDSYNFEGYISSTPRPSGKSPSLSLHLGAESEVLHDSLKVRLGTYTEPDRVHEENLGRMHVTGGVEYHAFDLYGWQWRLGLTFDKAPRFANVMLGLGFWH